MKKQIREEHDQENCVPDGRYISGILSGEMELFWYFGNYFQDAAMPTAENLSFH